MGRTLFLNLWDDMLNNNLFLIIFNRISILIKNNIGNQHKNIGRSKNGSKICKLSDILILKLYGIKNGKVANMGKWEGL